jgi:LPLT family lysophospholipid transporter-like MFS transporter
MAFAVAALVGAFGGFFLIPLNALLQERGHQSVGAGNAVAAQNLCENSAMLLMIGLYISIVRGGASISAVAAVFGSAVSLAIGCLWLYRRNAASRAQVSRAG